MINEVQESWFSVLSYILKKKIGLNVDCSVAYSQNVTVRQHEQHESFTRTYIDLQHKALLRKFLVLKQLSITSNHVRHETRQRKMVRFVVLQSIVTVNC